MPNVNERLIRVVNPVLVMGLTVLAYAMAYYIKRDFLPGTLRGVSLAPNHILVLLLILAVWMLIFQATGWVLPEDKVRLFRALKNTARGVTLGIIVIISLMFMLKITGVSRIMMGMFYVLDLALLGCYKLVLYAMLRRSGESANGARNILIIGSRDRAREMIARLGNDLWHKYRVIGCLDSDPARIGLSVTARVRVIDTVDNIKRVLIDNVVDEIIYAMPLDQVPQAGRRLALTEEMGIDVRILPDWQVFRTDWQPTVAGIRFDSFRGTPSLLLSTIRSRESDIAIKYAFDYIFAITVLLVISPLFLLIAAAIKLASPEGPVFFRHERCGLGGRRFLMYKFRTMVPDAEERLKELLDKNETDGPAFKIKHDPRIIPLVGTFLRKTQLDELPQLINIVRGEMSLIGPRPLMPWVVEKFDSWHRRRMSVKPGLTCLWQIAPHRNDLRFEEWMKLDLEYIDKWSIEQDLLIFAKTFKAVLLGAGR